jgi:two-component system sensor histidine kinase BaeS
MRPIAQAKNQSLTSSIGSSLTVNCSPDQIIRVLLNLTDNASKYTPVGGNIHVSAFSENGLTRISVADSGSGIAESHLHHLFERFYRVDESRSRGGGTGLGLAIANEIVTLHGGRIDVTSIPQRGSIFTVTLPAA